MLKLPVARTATRVNEPDDERHDPMNARTAAREQQPRTLLAARHQRLSRAVQNAYRQTKLLVMPPENVRRVALTGLVTGGLRRRSPRPCCAAEGEGEFTGRSPFRTYPGLVCCCDFQSARLSE